MDQKQLRHNFIQYLKAHYDYARPDIMASNVFYAWHNDIGMDFWEIFQDESSMRKAQELLTKKFEAIGRKNPKGHAGVYYGCWEKFRELLMAHSEIAREPVSLQPPASPADQSVPESVPSYSDRLNLGSIMDALRMKRKLFHSETDFQFALAWEIQTQYSEADMRLEYCPATAPNIHIDILVTLNDRAYPIELKYKTLEFSGTIDSEPYHLKSHGAQDIGKYDCLLDLQRTEKYRSLLHNYACGFTIWLTNDPSYWSAPQRSGTMAESFDISEASVKTGDMSWAPHTGEGTQRNRTDPISLSGAYTIHWREYSKLSESRSGRLRYAMIEVPK